MIFNKFTQVATNVKKIADPRQKNNIAACVELLAGINYSEDLIKMYLHDDILKESVTYQRILNDGGKQEAIAIVTRLLKKRFGEISETLKPQLNVLSIEQLKSLGESLLDFTELQDLMNWLENNT